MKKYIFLLGVVASLGLCASDEGKNDLVYDSAIAQLQERRRQTSELEGVVVDGGEDDGRGSPSSYQSLNPDGSDGEESLDDRIDRHTFRHPAVELALKDPASCSRFVAGCCPRSSFETCPRVCLARFCDTDSCCRDKQGRGSPPCFVCCIGSIAGYTVAFATVFATLVLTGEIQIHFNV